jgi:hypothetical protein
MRSTVGSCGEIKITWCQLPCLPCPQQLDKDLAQNSFVPHPAVSGGYFQNCLSSLWRGLNNRPVARSVSMEQFANMTFSIADPEQLVGPWSGIHDFGVQNWFSSCQHNLKQGCGYGLIHPDPAFFLNPDPQNFWIRIHKGKFEDKFFF